MVQNTDHFAIVVGIDHYSQFPPLQTANRDARAFVEWLGSPDGGGLPQQNIQTLLSPPDLPSNPLDARPQQWELDRTLRYAGAEGSVRIGKRLYFYFAGYGFSPSSDEVALLMANASPTQPGSRMSLKAYRQFFQERGLFDEVVFILDCSHQLIDPVQLAAPTLVRTAGSATPTVNDFVITHINLDTPDRRGLLTLVVLEGLRGAAVDTQGQITASSLGSYVQKRLPELAATLNLQPQVALSAGGGEILFSSIAAEQLNGTLLVEVPHWTTVVRVYDNMVRPVANIGPVLEDPQAPGHYHSETTLSPGIYEVEVALENIFEEQVVLIHPQQTVRIKRDTWKKLKFTATAPLTGATTSRETHTNPAVEWSRKTTWSSAPGGNSRLFLFVRTLKPQQYPLFADGLYLLDGEGRLLSDFSTDVEKHAQDGWMAFNADLPAGFYILQRVRRGVHARHQPIYLCRGWETHVFLQARTNPSLRSMTLNMARIGQGFHPDDETAIAAEVVLDSLRHGQSSGDVVASEKVTALLQSKLENPWLGILAAYALLGSVPRVSRERETYTSNRTTPHLLNTVLDSLSQISDHPDVRALHLQDDQPAPAPFWHPPLLWAGLNRVQRHATRFVATVPIDCLTDCVIDNQLVNSPWTAWRYLDRLPLFDSTEPASTGRVKTRLLIRKEAPATPISTSTPAFLQAIPPKAPTFRLPLTAGEEVATASPQPSFTAPTQALTSLYDAQLIQKAQQLTLSGTLDALPDTVTLDPERDLNELLEQIKPEAVSEASGLPLARTEYGLERLRQQGGSRAQDAEPDASADVKLTQSQQAILEYALHQSEQVHRAASYSSDSGPQVAALGPASSDAANEPLPSTTLVTIEELVTKLRAEADRLLLLVEEEAVKGSTEYPVAAQSLAARLEQVAKDVLKCADFIVIVDAQGHMLYGNGAFLMLLALTDEATSDGTIDLLREEYNAYEMLEANQRAWEAALAAAPLSRSVLASPVPNGLFSEWDLQRTSMEDSTKNLPLGYLNVLRGKNADVLMPNTLEQMSALLPKLTLYASFFAYGSTEHQRAYIQELEALTMQFEDITRTSITPNRLGS